MTGVKTMLRVCRWGAALGWVMILASGCSGGETPAPDILPSLTPRPTVIYASPTPLIQVGLPGPTLDATGQSAGVSGDAAAYTQGALNALATTLNVPAPSITVVSEIEAQWPDSSLGCPQPGQAYVQAVTSGYVFILKSGDTDYEVHVDKDQHYVVCAQQANAGATPTPPDPVVAEFIQQARVDLATKLGIAPDTVAVISSEAHDWSDGNLGCAPSSSKITPEAGPISGYKIVLAVEDKYYEYHTSFETMYFCEKPTE